MSHKLVEQIRFELTQIRQLLAESREFINASERQAPTAAHRWALGAVLHSFYNGVENILKRISAANDGKPAKDGQWHVDLLTQMSKPTAKRNAVISASLLDILKKYLAFRHLFRSIYTHELKWEPMEELVSEFENVAVMFEEEINLFCLTISDNNSAPGESSL